MAIEFDDAGADDEAEVTTSINTTPLIDVLLVLLVMLIITIPIQLHAVKLALPTAAPATSLIAPRKIQIDIDAQNIVHWQGQPVSAADLDANMAALALQDVQAEVHVRPDKRSRYAVFASVLATSKRHGLARMAVIGSEQFVE